MKIDLLDQHVDKIELRTFYLLDQDLESSASTSAVSDLVADNAIETEANDDCDDLHGGEEDGDLLEDAQLGGEEEEEEEEASLHGEDDGDGDVGDCHGQPRLLLFCGPQLQLVEQ